MNQSDSALAAIDQFLPDLVRTITVCVPLQEKGVEAELQLLYPVRAFQQHPSFRSLVNNLESEMQRFVQVHLPA